ncbi:MAG: hypothetical protein JWN31_485, partial [Frankiales bacterium]|nr:hypothetical protein [Frankiales bacterium]
MTVLVSRPEVLDDERRTAMLEQLALVDAEVQKALAGGGDKYVQRHHDRGK